MWRPALRPAIARAAFCYGTSCTVCTVVQNDVGSLGRQFRRSPTVFDAWKATFFRQEVILYLGNDRVTLP